MCDHYRAERCAGYATCYIPRCKYVSGTWLPHSVGSAVALFVGNAATNHLGNEKSRKPIITYCCTQRFASFTQYVGPPCPSPSAYARFFASAPFIRSPAASMAFPYINHSCGLPYLTVTLQHESSILRTIAHGLDICLSYRSLSKLRASSTCPLYMAEWINVCANTSRWAWEPPRRCHLGCDCRSKCVHRS
jgi:hypothetical protein